MSASSAGDTIGRYRSWRRREISTVSPQGLVEFVSAPCVHCSVKSRTCTDTRGSDIFSLQANRQLDNINGMAHMMNAMQQLTYGMPVDAKPQHRRDGRPSGLPAAAGATWPTCHPNRTAEYSDSRREASGRQRTAWFAVISLCIVGHAQRMRRRPRMRFPQMQRVPDGCRTVGDRSRR